VADDTLTAEQYNELMARRKPGKYLSVKTEVDGITFDSQAEATHYWDLKQRDRAGEIRDLELQPVFPLIVNGVKVAQYRADFAYVDVGSGRRVIEDVKSETTRRTSTYRLKKKMVKAIYGIDIEEVMV
jgi:hypothetical protein